MNTKEILLAQLDACHENTWFVSLRNSIDGLTEEQAIYAILGHDFTFKPDLQYFLQVKLHFSNKGQIIAEAIEGNGSGDFANLADTDAFLELPLEKSDFKKGEVFKVLKF